MDKQMENINKKIEELGREEKDFNENYYKDGGKNKETAISTLRECINELLEIDDLKASRDANIEEYNNRILTIVHWFSYLMSQDNNEELLNEAKELFTKLGEKHPQYEGWYEELINRKNS